MDILDSIRAASSSSYPPPRGAGVLPAGSSEALLDAAPWGVLLLAPTGTVTYLNALAAGLWGVPATSIIGYAPAQVVPAVLPAELLAALSTPSPATAAYWLPQVQQWISLRTIPGPEGQHWLFWEVVTARYQAEQQMLQLTDELARRGTDQYQALLGAVNQSFCRMEVLFDETGEQAVDFRYLELNPLFARESGLQPDAEGKTIRELVPDIDPFWVDFYGQVALTGEAAHREYSVPQLSRWYEVHTFRLGVPTARQVGVLFTDITARKQAEQRQQYVGQLTDALRPLADPLAIQREALAVLRTHLGGTRTLYAEALDQEGTMYISTEDRDPGLVPMEGLIMRFQDFTPDGLAEAQAGRPLWRSDVLTEAHTPEQQAGYATFGTRAWLMVPLVKNGRLVADLTVHSATSRAWTAHDIALVQETTERTWAAVERARAEAALRASEAQFRAVANLGPDLLWRSSPDNKTTWYNQRWYEYTGQTPEEAAGDGWKNVIHPDDQAESSRRYQAAIATVQPLRLEHRLRSVRGEYRWFQVRATPLRNEQGTVSAWYGSATDIHDRRLAEEALRASEEKYRTLFDSIDEGFALEELEYDANGEITDIIFREVNRAYERQSGLTGVVGKSAKEVLPSMEQHWKEVFAQVAKTGEPVRLINYTQDVDRWFDTYITLLAGSDKYVAVVFNDITERKQRELSTALLDEIGQELAILSAPDELMQTVGKRLSEFLGLSGCYFVDVDEAKNEVTVHHGWASGQVPSLLQTFKLDEYLSEDFVRTMRAGELFVLHDTAHDARAEAQRYAQLQVGSFVTVPFFRQGRYIGHLAVTAEQAREWQPQEIELLQEIASRIFPRIERARVEEALAASEQRLQIVFDALPVGIGLTAADGRLTMANQQMQRYLPTGIMPSRDDTQPLRWYAEGPDGHPLPPTEFPGARAQRGERVVPGLEMLHTPAEGPPVWTQVFAVPLQYRHSQVVGHVTVILDIDARKRTEEALRESEENYRVLVNQAVAGIFKLDLSGRVIFSNEQVGRMLGYPPAELLRLTVDDLVHPADLERTSTQFERLVREGRPFGIEKRLLRKDGTVIWVNNQLSPILGPDQQPQAAAVVSIDITEHKIAEQALRASEAQLAELNTQLEQRVARRTQQLQQSRDLLRTVFDTSLISMSVLYAVRDEAGQVLDFRLGLVNKEVERKTGRTDLVGKRYAQEYPGIRQVGLFDLMLHVLATNEPQSMEYFYEYEGFNRWYLCQFVKLGDGLVATNLDITERKLAEQERLKNLRLLEQAEAVAGIGSWEYDLRTTQFTWSAGMYHLFGLPQGQPVQLGVILDVVLEDGRAQAEHLRHCIATGACDIQETVQLRVGGQVRTVRIRAVVLHDDQDQPLKVLGMNLDISELKRLEDDNLRLRLGQQHALFEAVQAAQEAERKRMAESLHNGIGQILYATKLRLDRLHVPLLGTDPALVEARREADRLLSEAISRTRALSHELVPITLEKFGLPTALRDIAREMSSPHLRLRSHVLLDEDAAPLTPSLELALYRMAQELALNIARHARGATQASLELETTPGWVLLRAEDNGPGFGPASAASAGLGLRSIRDRVALLGGQLESGSGPAGGAYVRIRIPLPPADSAPR